MKRRTLVISLAVLAATSLAGAFSASSAWAAHSGNQWTVAGTALTNGQTKAVTPSLMSEKLELTVKVQNQPFRLTATGLKCTTGSTCRIKQVIEGEAAHAYAEGKLTFSGVSFDEPAGCGSESEITTAELKAEVIKVGGATYAKFSPASGTTFVNLKITGCAYAETYPLKGSVCTETNPLGTETPFQKVVFSKAINAAGCGEGSLKFGAEPAFIVGEATNKLEGEAAWGAKAF